MRVAENVSVKNIKCGDVYFANLSGQGSLQTGLRPVVVVSNDIGNYYSGIVTVMPLTSKHKKDLPTHMKIKPNDINGLRSESIILGEQITTINQNQLGYKIGQLTESELKEARLCAINMMGLNCFVHLYSNLHR